MSAVLKNGRDVTMGSAVTATLSSIVTTTRTTAMPAAASLTRQLSSVELGRLRGGVDVSGSEWNVDGEYTLVSDRPMNKVRLVMCFRAFGMEALVIATSVSVVVRDLMFDVSAGRRCGW